MEILSFLLVFDKLLEKAVAGLAREILDSSGLFDRFSPGLGHSRATEAALVKVINGLNAVAEKEAWPCLYYQI